MENKCFLVSMVIIAIFSYIPYMMVVPFLPFELEKRGLSQSYSGIVFGAYSVSFILVPFFLSHYLFDKIGRKRVFIIGEFLQGGSLIFYALLHYVKNPTAYLVLTILTRIVQGMGSSVLQTTSYSMLSIIFHNYISRAVSAFYFGVAVGSGLGPLIGGFLYDLIGFTPAFSIVGSVTILMSLFVFIFPKNVDIKWESSDDVAQRNQNVVKVCDLLKIQRVILAVCNVICTVIAYSFFQPIISIKLKVSFDFSQSQIAYFLAGYTISIAISGLILIFFPQNCEKRYVIIIGNYIAVLGIFFMGPSKILNLPNQFQLMLVGLILNGFGGTAPHSLTMAEIVNGGKQKYQSQVARLSDISSGLLNSLRGVILFLSPVVSQVIFNNYGFQVACDTFGSLYLIFSCIYMALTILDIWSRKEMRKKRKFQSLLNDLEGDDEVEQEQNEEKQRLLKFKPKNDSMSISSKQTRSD